MSVVVVISDELRDRIAQGIMELAAHPKSIAAEIIPLHMPDVIEGVGRFIDTSFPDFEIALICGLSRLRQYGGARFFAKMRRRPHAPSWLVAEALKT